MALAPDVESMATPSVNKPASGTYGDGQRLADLKKQMPSSGTANTPGGNVSAPPMSTDPPMVSPTPPPGNNSPQQPATVPPVLFGPTGRPNEPVGTLPADSAFAPEQPFTGPQARMEMLIRLANSPDVSEQTKEWAQLWIRSLTRVGNG